MAKYKIFGKTFFEVEREQRSDLGSLANPTKILTDALGGGNTSAGVSVTVNTALSLSAVWRAVNVNSGTLAALPLKVYKSGDKGREQIRTNAAHKVIKRPNPMMTAFIFRETMQAIVMMWGNAYAYIKRDSRGEPVELMPVHPSNVYVFKGQDGLLYYKIKISGEPSTVPHWSMIHIPGLSFDGLKGYSPLAVMRESIGGAIATQRFGNNFYEKGGNVGGVLEVPGELSDNAYKRLKDSWNNQSQGIENASSTALLEGGTKYTKIGIPPEEAQFLQTRQFQVSEIARWFGTPPHLLMDLERSTNNNIEHQGMEYVTYTLLPWAKRWEEELSRKLIKESDQDDLYIEHDFNGLLRADSKSRSESYKSLFGIGAITPNQIATFENMPTYPDGDQRFVQAAYAPIDRINDFYKGKSPANTKTDE